MDTITHLALGAVVGETIAGKEIGRKALVIGALAQTFPDVDILAALWLSPAENLVAHRGITHSLLAWVFFTIFFTFLATVIPKQKQVVSQRLWLFFFAVQIGIHLFIDSFNAYGTGLFEPFHSVRISFHSIYVADPLFATGLIIASLVLLFAKKMKRRNRLQWAYISIGISSIYLVVSVFNKFLIDKEVRSIASEMQVPYQDFMTTPTPFNTLLWYVVIRGEAGYYTGYRSVFDDSKKMEFYFVEQHEPLHDSVKVPEITDDLIRLSQGYYVYTIRHDTLAINLLTFGQVAGWKNPDAKFVLECDLIPEETTLALLQEGRAGEMNVPSMTALAYRIFNEKNPDPYVP